MNDSRSPPRQCPCDQLDQQCTHCRGCPFVEFSLRHGGLLMSNFKGRVRPNPARDEEMASLFRAGMRCVDIG